MANMPEKNLAFCWFSGATSNLVDVQQTSSIPKLNVGIIINLVWSSASELGRRSVVGAFVESAISGETDGLFGSCTDHSAPPAS